MISQYQTTGQGQKTRSLIIECLATGELSRDDLVSYGCGLTYDQVRRQTKNLCIDGTIKSRLEGGKRMYKLCTSFIHSSVVSA